MREPGPNKLGIDRQQKVFRGEDGASAARYAVLVNGDEQGECKLPGGANASSLAGVAYQGVADGDAVALSEHNYEKLISAGPIPYGSRLNVADAQGRVKAVDETAGDAVTLAGMAEQEATEADQEIVANLRLFGTHAVA